MQKVGGPQRTVGGCQDPPALRLERHPHPPVEPQVTMYASGPVLVARSLAELSMTVQGSWSSRGVLYP